MKSAQTHPWFFGVICLFIVGCTESETSSSESGVSSPTMRMQVEDPAPSTVTPKSDSPTDTPGVADQKTTQTLSEEARQLKAAYEASSADTASNILGRALLFAFPNNKATFIAVFDPPDFGNLYHGSFEILERVEGCVKYDPQIAGDKLIAICKDLHEGVDAVGYIKHMTVSYGIYYPDLFAEKIHGLASSEMDGLIRFLADVENHGAYPEYQDLINALKTNGYDQLAAACEQARTSRKASTER